MLNNLIEKWMIEKFSYLLIIAPLIQKIIEGLKNIESLFLPPNTTSKIHPCDAEIIRAFKMHYCHQFYRNLLEGYEIGIPNLEKINVLDVMNLAILAWITDDQESTITNCFRHCKIRSMDNVASKNLDQHSDDKGIQQLHVLIKELKYCDTMDVEYLLNYPGENEATSELLSDKTNY